MEITDFFTAYQNAAWDKNTVAMANLYDERAVIFDMWDKGYIADQSAWVEEIQTWFGSLGEEKVKVEFEMIRIHQCGDTGFASALVKFRAIAVEGAVLRSMTNRITVGFLKFESDWKVIHQHISAPISSKGLTAILSI